MLHAIFRKYLAPIGVSRVTKKRWRHVRCSSVFHLVACVLLVICVCASFNPGYFGTVYEAFAKRLSVVGNRIAPVVEHLDRFVRRPRPFDRSLLSHLVGLNLTKPCRGEKSSRSSSSTRLVFVTAASSNHFCELRGLMASVNQLTPNATVVVYDLGMTQHERNELRSWRSVEYARFEFDKYPPHVRDLKKYAWKPIIVAEQLNRFYSFFYVDSSARLLKSDFSAFSNTVATGMLEPFLLFSPTDHSILAATHPEMYDYFPVDRTYLNSTMQATTLMYITDSAFAREFLRRFVLCALAESCIAPPGSKVKCNDVFYDTKQPELFNAYDECHRYDQSAANLIRLQMLFIDGYYRGLNGSENIPEWDENRKNSLAYFASDKATGLVDDRAPRQSAEQETSSRRKRVIEAIDYWNLRLTPTERYFAIGRGFSMLETLLVPCTT